MSLSVYKELFRQPRMLPLYAIGLFVRFPHAAGGIAFTLHVRKTLEMNYFFAGVAATAAAIGWGIGSPWRGRLVDKNGVRRTLIPSTIIEAACWIALPFLPYWWLVVVALVQGCYMVPAFSLVRQAITVMAPKHLHQAGLSLDAVFAEIAFVIGPLLAATLVHLTGSRAVLVGIGVITVGSGLALIWFNPPTRLDQVATQPKAQKLAQPFRITTPVIVVLSASATASILFQGVDLALVRSMEEWNTPGWLGPVAAVWSVGSIGGGLIYGVLNRKTNPTIMVALMAAMTAPAALANGPIALGAWLILSGLVCAPALTSINQTLTDLTPESRRTEVFGWSGTAMTVGASLWAPLVGLVLDHGGAKAGYLASAGIGTLFGLVGYLLWRHTKVNAATLMTTDHPNQGGTQAEASPT
ncbi:MAG: MFS transporter [Micrococcales bacterium]|nr:MFS transporter [Micrococcales bacterium]